MNYHDDSHDDAGHPLETLRDRHLRWQRQLARGLHRRKRQIQQWIVRNFMRDLHDNYVRLLNEVDDLWMEQSLAHHQSSLYSACLLTLVARDDDGRWTTVLAADTVLTPEVSDQLTQLVNRS